MSELSGVRVAVTRPRTGGRELRDALERRGAAVVELPLLEIAPPDSFSALDAALDWLTRYAWIAFTSGNAVEPVLARLRERGQRLPAELRIAAVGPATVERLRRQGVPVHCCPSQATAAALGAAMTRLGVAGQRVLVPGGDRSRPDLADTLRAAGAQVDPVVVYRTVAAPDTEKVTALLMAREVDVVALASPSAVEGLMGAAGEPALLGRVRLVCIGPTTADAVRRAGLEPAAVAEPHTAEGLAAAIAALYTE